MAVMYSSVPSSASGTPSAFKASELTVSVQFRPSFIASQRDSRDCALGKRPAAPIIATASSGISFQLAIYFSLRYWRTEALLANLFSAWRRPRSMASLFLFSKSLARARTLGASKS